LARQLIRDMQRAAERDAAATPGQASMTEAAGAMDQAGDKLGAEKADEANPPQNEALEKLDKARSELNEAIREAQEQVKAETLVQMERLLREMLEAQHEINRETVATFAKRRGGRYERAEQLKLRALADREGGVAADAAKAVEMLNTEGSTAVFPAVLGEVGRDMKAVQQMLGDRQAGPLTQTIADQIAANLADLLAALQDAMKRSGGGGGGGCGGGALIDIAAELRMLRLMQLHVNQRTVVLNAAATGGSVDDKQSRRRHQLLSDRQKRIRELTQQLQDKLQPAAEGEPDADAR